MKRLLCGTVGRFWFHGHFWDCYLWEPDGYYWVLDINTPTRISGWVNNGHFLDRAYVFPDRVVHHEGAGILGPIAIEMRMVMGE
ncbi:hypothetical protein [Aquiflexum sp.]|uniref:hypothetical protein n=1 Tax=Aquiflexum sp. TaxID=1872584 RepID=UPI0035935E89